MIYLENNVIDAAYSLAVEEFMLNYRTSGEYLMLWRSAPTVVIGKFQNAYGEVSTAETARRGIALVRRNSGGGTVYHDTGNLNFTMFADRGDSAPDYERFLTPVVAALRELGVPARIGDSFDITVDGKKVSGNAQSVVKNRVMHHGTLLFDSDLTVLHEVTGHASESVKSKAIRSNPSPVCNIRPFLVRDMEIAEFTEFLKTALCGKAPEVLRLSEEEIIEITRLADEKYRAWDWNYGKSPAFTKDCGAFSVDVKSGVILAVHGDDALAEALVGARMHPEEVRSRLDGRDAHKEEIVNILF